MRDMKQETVYCERANGRFEYWVYADGRKICVGENWAENELRRGAILNDLR